MALWLSDQPLLLASKSVSRRSLLQGAGIPIKVIAADINERAVEAKAGLGDPGGVAALLAREKALAVPAPGRLVLGADQTLALGQRRFSKPVDRTAARGQLKLLRGQVHMLHSTIAIVRDGNPVFEHCATARLTMRAFSDAFLEAYLDAAGAAVTASVGAYQVEGLGVHLFGRIEGEHSTILGLPLLPSLEALRREGVLSA